DGALLLAVARGGVVLVVDHDDGGIAGLKHLFCLAFVQLTFDGDVHGDTLLFLFKKPKCDCVSLYDLSYHSAAELNTLSGAFFALFWQICARFYSAAASARTAASFLAMAAAVSARNCSSFAASSSSATARMATAR